MAAQSWKKGRGKLGIFAPLLGAWQAEGDTPRGPGRYARTFTKVLGGSHIQLAARWTFGDQTYEELALIGVARDGTITFWSFTSDGKQAVGELVEAGDLHPAAIAFEAEMPAGRARMAYWPDEQSGFHWVVESKTQKGWNRFTHHHYRQVAED